MKINPWVRQTVYAANKQNRSGIITGNAKVSVVVYAKIRRKKHIEKELINLICLRFVFEKLGLSLNRTHAKRDNLGVYRCMNK
jgi:hypothetical protein